MGSNNTETSEFGTEKVLLQGHARRWVVHPLKTQTPRKLLAKHFSRKGEGEVWVVAVNFLVPKSYVLAGVHIGQVIVFLEASNKTNGILFLVTFYFYTNGQVLYL